MTEIKIGKFSKICIKAWNCALSSHKAKALIASRHCWLTVKFLDTQWTLSQAARKLENVSTEPESLCADWMLVMEARKKHSSRKKPLQRQQQSQNNENCTTFFGVFLFKVLFTEQHSSSRISGKREQNVYPNWSETRLCVHHGSFLGQMGFGVCFQLL